VDSSSVASKKHGFFKAEEKIAHEVLKKVGLQIGLRHPLAYVMEACDDIAYAVLDIEDAVKKGLASFSDLMEYLKHDGEKDARDGKTKDEVVLQVQKQACEKHAEYRSSNLSPAELNDVSMQRFRVFAIGALVNAAIEAFREHRATLLDGSEKQALLKLGKAKKLRKLLGDFAVEHAFKHRSVLEIELHGHNTIRGLMDIFWKAIQGTNPQEGRHEPDHPYDRYVYSRISENYRRIYSKPTEDVAELPLRYRQCLLLTDMISGMTDSYAMSLLSELRSFGPLNG
jgi:dGTPase